MLNGDLYHAFGESLSKKREIAFNLFTELNALGKSNPNRRQDILNQLLGFCSEDVCIEPPFYCDY